MIFNTKRLSLVGIILVFSALAARADLLPAPTFSIVLNGGTAITTEGTYVSGSSYGQIMTWPLPTLHANVAGSGSSLLQLRYWFTVMGPKTDIPIPLLIAGFLHYSVAGESLAAETSWGVSAQITATSFDTAFKTQVDQQFRTVSCFKPSGTVTPVCPDGKSRDVATVFSLNVIPNAFNEIEMDMSAFIPDGGILDAFADPLLSFDPAFNSTGYTIVMTDGFSNPQITTTPEPATWTLAASLAMAGLFLKHVSCRRRTVVPSPRV